MNKLDLFKMSITNLFRRKTRTILTVLGVVIGTSSIIIMLSLGVAMDQNFKEQLSQMGSLNIIEVHEGYEGYNPGPVSPSKDGEVRLDDQAVARFESIPGVEAVMPEKTAYVRIAAGKLVGDIPVTGIRPELLPAFDFEVEEGRLLQAADKEAIIFGKQVAYNFFNPRLHQREFNYGPDPSAPPQVNLINNNLLLTSDMTYGERRRTNPDDKHKPPRPYPVKGVGILKESNSEKDYRAYMNMSYLGEISTENINNQADDRERRRRMNENGYETIKIKVPDIHQVQTVQEQVKSMGYQTHSLTDILESMKKTSRTIQAILGGIGAVSLLVAAIGITNTMIMSIYERTREIGIIKVLGADIADIKRIFLLEAGLIGFGGGLLGLAISYLVSLGLNQAAAHFMGGMGPPGQISVISPVLALSAVAFATLVGIISGYSPARRAMNLSALDAIRNE
ncbi:ABC transporter permease [Syntrophomonas erecta]